MATIEGNYKPDVKTVKKKLQQKFGEDIFIIDQRNRECIICFRNIGYKLLADRWYEEKETNPRQEKLPVLREAAAIIRADIRSTVYETEYYPPSDDFMKNARDDVPASLQCLLSEIITKDKRGCEEMWQKKCISIAHAIITAVRPRSFLSPLQIGVGTYLYKKFESRNLINILSALGFSASYFEIQNFERANISRPQSNVLENSFSQFVI